jgi:UDP-N-acetyl-2-amino-2-deoxyglucuronate dehydrogenase
MGKLRFGLVGVGDRGAYWATALKTHPDVDLVGICEIRPDILKKAAFLTRVQVATEQYEELLKLKLDAVVIATPHYLHAPMTIAAAENNINVICEKPMAITCKECDDIIRSVRQNDVKLAIGFQHRFDSNYIKIKQAIDQNLLGNVFQINCIVHWWRDEMYYETSPEHWKGRWVTEGGGTLINQSVHFIDIFQWLGGPINDIQASATISEHEFQETEDNVNAIVNFKNGAMGIIQSGIIYEHNRGEDLGVYGTKGSMIWEHNKLHDSLGGKAKRNPILKSIKNLVGHPVLNNFIEAIKTDNKKIISVDGEEGKKSIEIIRGIYMSQMQNKKISFPVVDNGSFPVLGKFYKTEL